MPRFSFDSWTPFQMDKGDSRFYAGLPNLAMACCMPLGGWLTGLEQRSGLKSAGSLVPKLGLLISSLCLLGGILSHERGWVVLWFTLSLGILGLCEAAFWTLAVKFGGTQGGTAAAIMNTGGNGVGLLAPMITPLIASKLGWTWGLGLGVVIGLLGSLCWLGVKPSSSNPDHHPHENAS